MRNLLRNLQAAIAFSVLSIAIAHADSTIAECGFSPAIDIPPASTSVCTFSQRQGFVSIYFDAGREFDLRPTGDAPGNFIDADGRAVYRRSGLGNSGQIFMLPDEFLFVYWPRLICTPEQLADDSGCVLGGYSGVGFQINATDSGSLNQLSLQANGLANGPESFSHEIDGAVYRAELGDLDANGWPELYIYISSAGSGSYGSLVAYAVNAGKSIGPIYLPSIADTEAASDGYMGHDEFAVVENRLVRRFPIYREGDTNAEPTGGMRQLQYRLVAGEAGWQLEIDKVIDF